MGPLVLGAEFHDCSVYLFTVLHKNKMVYTIQAICYIHLMPSKNPLIRTQITWPDKKEYKEFRKKAENWGGQCRTVREAVKRLPEKP